MAIDDFNRDEWGATALGFLGFFFGLAFIVLGLLPMWLLLVPLAVVAAVGISAIALVRQFLPHR